jgi:tetratricopeptide (TPR) repeat protein
MQRLQDVRELANSLLFEVYDAVAELPGATQARRLILERGFANLDSISRQIQRDPELEWELAEAYLRVGLVQGQPTGASLGDLDAARISYTRAIEIASGLVERRPDDLRARRTLALAYEKLGDVQAWTGRIEEGVQHARNALSLYRSIADAAPDSVRHRRSLAISLVKLGDLTGHPVFPNLGRADESLGHYQAALDILRAPPLSVEPTWDTRRYQALVEERVGMMHRITARFGDARASFRRSLAEREKLAAEQPTHADARRDVGVTHQNLCEVERALGNPARALTHCRGAVTVYEELHAADLNNAQALSDVAVGSLSLAGALEAVGDTTGALGALQRSIDVLHAALEKTPDNLPNRVSLGRALARHSLVSWQLGRRAPYAGEALDALTALRAERRLDADDEQLLRSLERRLGPQIGQN